tara:strand:+ start:34108 stop:34551 length:444 start_codon:yes stop_codon:yes gene_type:complete
MKKITIILICLYLIHVLFSDQLFDFTTLFKGEYIFKLDKRLKSSLALSYISFLALALCFEKTNNETFFIAFLFSSISFIGYIANFSHYENYETQIVKHSLLLLPIIFLDYTKITSFSFKTTYITYLAIFYLIFLKMISHTIYNIQNI